MKTLNLVQGSPEWHAHRASHWNASDAAAMLGISPYKTRKELLREYASGVAPAVDEATQARFDDGHRFEALARPLAEKIIGEELYPCVGVEGRYSASFDGLTLLGDTAFEHKSFNSAIVVVLVREGATGNDLPELYRVQMEHQCMVSGARRVLFMISTWHDNGELHEEMHGWYTPDRELRSRIAAGWAQFEADLAAYGPELAEPVAVGRAPSSLPALRIELTGLVTASNLAEFKEVAIAKFRSISTDLQTDQDFADAEQTVKWCGDIEDRLEAAKQHALSQTASIDELFRTIDEIRTEARSKRLELNKLVTGRKETIRHEIVDRARASVAEHYNAINATMGAHALPIPSSINAELANAIKGRKTITSLNDAADTAAASLKIAASQLAERVRSCMAVLTTEGGEFDLLFPDRVQLCATKAPDDLRNLIHARIAAHKEREEARKQAEQPTKMTEVAATARAIAEADPKPACIAPTPASARINLGDLNTRIWPLSITAEGLTKLGFNPVGKQGASRLYATNDFPLIVAAMIRSLQVATQKAAA